ncbi:hypothetical protein SAMN02910323_2369 [Selenomonas ruminantium]|uniref:Outer membrane lipoprotein-sorting protein n=2 Tax=Selenomonas ruminantium TaxID=971 RepID=A0A1K1Q4B3_SELRU|nr:hypothetical protein SAMN02910323_2369 [Selenomonas ruminantium]
MDWKKIVAGFFVSGLMMGMVSAQQPAETDYRNMLQQQEFVLSYEYDGQTEKVRIIGDPAKRMTAVLETRGKKNYWMPKVLGTNDKLYQFYEEKGMKAKVLPLNMLGSDKLSPDEKWLDKKVRLALPEELSVLAWQDKWTSHPQSLGAPVFSGSSKRQMGSDEYDCDQYICDIRNQAGGVSGQLAYNLLYKDGKLVKVQKYLLYKGTQQLLSTLNIMEFQAGADTGALSKLNDIKVYKAELGDINDLLDNPVEEGTIGGSLNAQK